MRLPFTHGIVRYQTDNQQPATPTFLQRDSGNGTINLVVAPDELILSISHKAVNYLVTESVSVPSAWVGSFTPGTTYWLYVDINKVTAVRTFGSTIVEPLTSATLPTSPTIDQHWFDTSTRVMKVFDASGTFVEKIRVFVGQLVEGSVLVPYPLGSSVGLNTTPSISGSILFDNDSNPLRKSTGTKLGEFFTTETNFNTQSTAVSSISIEGQMQVATSISNIAAFQCVSYTEPYRVTFASSNNVSRKIDGIIVEDIVIGDQANIVTSGVVTNPAWNWIAPVSTNLFCDSTGQITTVVPTQCIQVVGSILSPTSIKVNIGPKIVVLD